jgi:hypothetical protein
VTAARSRPAAPRARRDGATPRSGRRSVAGAGALLALAAGLAVGAPAPAAEAAACSSATGVTVVVDFGSLGGVQTGCAGGDPGSGLAALAGAGHGYTFVPRQFGLVCQIDARPNPCNGAPTTAYWSYWHASRGGSWSYSTVGAGGYDPKPGTVEGWAFGAGRQPGIAPPAAPAPARPAPKPTTNPAPKPTTQPPAGPPRTSAPAAGAPTAPGAPGPSAGGGAPRGTGPGSAPGAARTSPGRTTGAPSTSAGPTATDGTSASSTGAGAAPSTSDSGPPATEPASSSTTIGAFSLAVALIAALGLAAFLIARRRRAGPPL